MAVKAKKDDKKAPLDWRTKKQSAGIGGFFEGIAGGASDLMRGGGNALTDFGDFLASRPATTKGGSAIFGPDSTDRRGGGGAFGGTPTPRPAADQIEDAPAKALTFADYLKMANEMGLGAGGGADYSALMNQLKSNAAAGDSKLAAMYSQLRGSIDADAPGIQQNYDNAGQQMAAASDEAAAQTNAGFNAARDAQTKQLAALGIGDAAGVLAANGGQAANDQAVAQSNVAQNKAINQSQNVAHKTSAVNYNTGIGNAVGLEGAVQRAGLQQQLANKLAELETDQANSQTDGSKNAFSAAFQMAQNPNIFDPNYQAPVDVKSELEAQLLAGKITAQDYKNQALASNTGGVGANLTQYQTLAQAYGVDPSDQEAFLNFIKLVNATQ